MAGSEATLGKTLGHGDRQPLCHSVIQQLSAQRTAILGYDPPVMTSSIQHYFHYDTHWYSNLLGEYTHLNTTIQQQSNYDNHINTAIYYATILLLLQQSFCNPSVLLHLIQPYSHCVPHTYTVICFITILLIPQKFICYDTINIENSDLNSTSLTTNVTHTCYPTTTRLEHHVAHHQLNPHMPPHDNPAKHLLEQRVTHHQ
jgi:hypothetical protein